MQGSKPPIKQTKHTNKTSKNTGEQEKLKPIG